MSVVAGSIPAEFHGVIRGIHLSGHFLRNPTFEAVRTGFHRRTNDCWFESNFGGFPESLLVEQRVVRIARSNNLQPAPFFSSISFRGSEDRISSLQTKHGLRIAHELGSCASGSRVRFPATPCKSLSVFSAIPFPGK